MLDKKLIALLGGAKIYISVITVINIIGMLSGVGIIYCLGSCLYLVYSGCSGIKDYAVYMTAALLLAAVRFFAVFVNGRLKNGLGGAVKKDLRAKTYKKLLDLGINGTEETTASLTQMSIEGIEQLDLYYSNYLPQFFFAMISPVILFAICVTIEWKTALVLLACLPLIPVSIIAVSKYAKKIFAKYWDKYTSMGDSFLDNLQGMKDLKIFNADEFKQIETNLKSEEFRKITMKVLVMQLVSVTIMDLVAFGGAAVAIVVALLSAKAQEIVPFEALFLILVSAEFFLPMRALGSAFHVAMNGATAGKKILSFLELPEKTWGDTNMGKIDSVTLEDVDFSYDGERYVLKNINMKFRRGFNSLVGESGSGKSTIVSLILRGYDVQSGQVSVNGAVVSEVERNSYYGRLALVSYNTFIFNASIRDNFRFAKSEVTDEEIYSALEKVNLKGFIEESGGLDYLVLEESENISGGQRQRLALAVNLVCDRDMYIFDEATSNIDIESEAVIMANIKKLAQSKIVIVISHRLQNVVESDLIYVLNKGMIVEKGKHAELIKNNGEYNKIYQKQYALENGYKEAVNA